MNAHEAPAQDLPPFDVSTAHPARTYDFLLGGKDNFAADRATAQAIIEVSPMVFACIRANGAFQRRTVRYLARDTEIHRLLGIGTGLFLGIGTGLPPRKTPTRWCSRGAATLGGQGVLERASVHAAPSA